MKARYLPFKDWPPALQESFTTFATWASAPMVTGIDATLRKRPVTVENYRLNFEAYFGFLHHVQQLPTLTFDQLFDMTLVTAYVHWHVNELHHKPTKAIYMFLQRLLSLTKQYRPLPELREQIRLLFKELPFPSPSFNKDDAWVPMATLDEIGRTLWPSKPPHSLRQDKEHRGRNSALHAGYSLMFRLWYYIPYRSRNMREMKFEENLHQATHGQWWITFSGEQLKVASRRGVPIPSTCPSLQRLYHCLKPIGVSSVLCCSRMPHNPRLTFSLPLRYTLTTARPFTVPPQHRSIAIPASTGIHISSVPSGRPNGSARPTAISIAAMMLNDKLETVIATMHISGRGRCRESLRLLDERNGQGK